MQSLIPIGSWIGDLRGTIVANIFAEFSEADGKLYITLRVNSNGAIFVLSGEVVREAELIVARLKGPSGSGHELTPLLRFDEVDQGQVTGGWEMPDGNAGIFRLAIANVAKNRAACDC